MLTCQQVTELVTDYLEGRLSFGERVSFQMHIGMCARCRSYLRQMKVTVATVGKVPDDPLPAPMREELLARFRHAMPRGNAGPVKVATSLRMLAALERAIGSRRGWMAAAAVVVVSAFVALRTSGLRPGLTGEGARCLLTELGTGGVLVAALAFLAAAKRTRVSPATFVVTAMTGSLGGFALIQATCDFVHATPHVIFFHVGGVVLAGAMGLAASRLLSHP